MKKRFSRKSTVEPMEAIKEDGVSPSDAPATMRSTARERQRVQFYQKF